MKFKLALLACVILHLSIISPTSAGVMSLIKDSMNDLTNLTIPNYPKGVMEKVKDTMNDYHLTNISLPVNYLSRGVMDRIRDTINTNNTINITIPAQYTPKGLWNTLTSTRFTFHVPPIPVVSNLWRRTNTSSSDDSKQKQVTTVSPVKLGGFASETSNWCGGNVLLDLNSRKQVTYKSTNFPGPRSSPYACSWDVKVAKNCKKGLVTLTLDERSRLAEQEKCTKGYFRVSPFMKEAKLCGPIGAAPAFQWYIDQDDGQSSEDVSIIMKNIGLNDGHPEGVAFSIKGECLDGSSSDDNNDEAALIKNVELSTRWMSDVISQSKLTTGGRKKGKIGSITLYSANMSLAPVSKLSATASDRVTVVEHFAAHSADAPHATLEPITDAGNDPGLKPTNIVFYSPLYLFLKRIGWLVK